MKKGKVKSVFCAFAAFCLSALGVCSVFERTAQCDGFADDLTLAAAAFIMPESLRSIIANSDDEAPLESEPLPTQTSEPATNDEEKPAEPVDLHEDENHYPVITSWFGESGVSCSNFYIKDSVGAGTDFDKLLDLPLGFELENTSEPQVLIFHTHTTESYIEYDEGYYHESFYPRTRDNTKNMVSVGEALAQSLRKQGVGVIHATQVHDYPEYTGAYDRSWETITDYIEEYPSIKVVLDIHRDSIAGEDGSKVKPTFEADGKKAAQIMIMAGCDPYNEMGFPDWEYNLRFALKLQETAEDMYPGMTRPLYFGYFAYNMPITRGSLLIEVGTDVNTVSEAQYTGKLLGNVLARVLQREG